MKKTNSEMCDRCGEEMQVRGSLIPGGTVMYGIGKILGWLLTNSIERTDTKTFAHSFCVECAGLLNVYLTFAATGISAVVFILLIIINGR